MDIEQLLRNLFEETAELCQSRPGQVLPLRAVPRIHDNESAGVSCWYDRAPDAESLIDQSLISKAASYSACEEAFLRFPYYVQYASTRCSSPTADFDPGRHYYPHVIAAFLRSVCADSTLEIDERKWQRQLDGMLTAFRDNSIQVQETVILSGVQVPAAISLGELGGLDIVPCTAKEIARILDDLRYTGDMSLLAQCRTVLQLRRSSNLTPATSQSLDSATRVGDTILALRLWQGAATSLASPRFVFTQRERVTRQAPVAIRSLSPFHLRFAELPFKIRKVSDSSGHSFGM